MGAALDAAETHFTHEVRHDPKNQASDSILIDVAAGLLSHMTGIPDQPLELLRMSMRDALDYADSLGDPKKSAFALSIVCAAYKRYPIVGWEEWVYTKPQTVNGFFHQNPTEVDGDLRELFLTGV